MAETAAYISHDFPKKLADFTSVLGTLLSSHRMLPYILDYYAAITSALPQGMLKSHWLHNQYSLTTSINAVTEVSGSMNALAMGNVSNESTLKIDENCLVGLIDAVREIRDVTGNWPSPGIEDFRKQLNLVITTLNALHEMCTPAFVSDTRTYFQQKQAAVYSSPKPIDFGSIVEPLRAFREKYYNISNDHLLKALEQLGDVQEDFDNFSKLLFQAGVYLPNSDIMTPSTLDVDNPETVNTLKNAPRILRAAHQHLARTLRFDDPHTHEVLKFLDSMQRDYQAVLDQSSRLPSETSKPADEDIVVSVRMSNRRVEIPSPGVGKAKEEKGIGEFCEEFYQFYILPVPNNPAARVRKEPLSNALCNSTHILAAFDKALQSSRGENYKDGKRILGDFETLVGDVEKQALGKPFEKHKRPILKDRRIILTEAYDWLRINGGSEVAVYTLGHMVSRLDKGHTLLR